MSCLCSSSSSGCNFQSVLNTLKAENRCVPDPILSFLQVCQSSHCPVISFALFMRVLPEKRSLQELLFIPRQDLVSSLIQIIPDSAYAAAPHGVRPGAAARAASSVFPDVRGGCCCVRSRRAQRRGWSLPFADPPERAGGVTPSPTACLSRLLPAARRERVRALRACPQRLVTLPCSGESASPRPRRPRCPAAPAAPAAICSLLKPPRRALAH